MYWGTLVRSALYYFIQYFIFHCIGLRPVLRHFIVIFKRVALIPFTSSYFTSSVISLVLRHFSVISSLLFHSVFHTLLNRSLNVIHTSTFIKIYNNLFESSKISHPAFEGKVWTLKYEVNQFHRIFECYIYRFHFKETC